MLARVFAVVDGPELENAKAGSAACTADTGATAGSGGRGLDGLSSRVRGRSLGCQGEESGRSRADLGDSLEVLRGRHDVCCVVDLDRVVFRCDENSEVVRSSSYIKLRRRRGD